MCQVLCLVCCVKVLKVFHAFPDFSLLYHLKLHLSEHEKSSSCSLWKSDLCFHEVDGTTTFCSDAFTKTGDLPSNSVAHEVKEIKA